MSVYLRGCTGSSLPPAPPGPRPQVRIKSAPGGSFWDQQPHKVFSFPLMAEAQEAHLKLLVSWPLAFQWPKQVTWHSLSSRWWGNVI